MSTIVEHEYQALGAMTRCVAELRHQAAHPIIVRDGDYLVLIDRLPSGEQRETYDVPVKDMRTAGGVAFWVRQLAPKTWVTKKHLELLAQAAIDLNPGNVPH